MGSHALELKSYALFSSMPNNVAKDKEVVYTTLCLLKKHSLHFVEILISLKALVGQYSWYGVLFAEMARKFSHFSLFCCTFVRYC